MNKEEKITWVAQFIDRYKLCKEAQNTLNKNNVDLDNYDIMCEGEYLKNDLFIDTDSYANYNPVIYIISHPDGGRIESYPKYIFFRLKNKKVRKII